MSIILVRHGETPLNVTRTMQPADTPLSTAGVAQAHAVARRLAGTGVAAILASDLPRARVTAEAIAAATGAPVTLTPLLHERNFGELRGQPYDTLGYNPFTMAEAPPGGESAETFRLRVAQAFAQIVKMRAGVPGNLAVVTHGLVIRALLANHFAMTPEQAVTLKVGNTSLSILGAETPHRIDLLDCTRHLDDDDAPHRAGSLSGG
jgi:probable phosphoglycerate mutase